MEFSCDSQANSRASVWSCMCTGISYVLGRSRTFQGQLAQQVALEQLYCLEHMAQPDESLERGYVTFASHGSSQLCWSCRHVSVKELSAQLATPWCLPDFSDNQYLRQRGYWSHCWIDTIFLLIVLI